MSKKKTHTPRTLCKSLTQMINSARTMHYSEFIENHEDRSFLYDIYSKCHNIRNKLMKEHNLDINNDFKPRV